MLGKLKKHFQNSIKSQMSMGHLCYKFLFWAINFVFFLLVMGKPSETLFIELLLFLGLNVSICIYSYLRFGKMTRIIQEISFILELCFVALLVRYSGGLDSPLILTYAVLLIRIGIKQQKFREVFIIGTLGHLIHVVSLYFYYDSFDFYFTIRFWIQCALLAGTFINVVIITWILNDRALRLKEAKEEAESLAQDLSKTNQELKERAITDVVTGLHNFRYFHEKLKKVLKQAQQKDNKLALIKLDVDNFKEYNSYVGTKKGDEALYQVGQILLTAAPEDSVVTRLGSDEFAIILKDVDKQEGKRISTKIRDEIHKYSFAGEEELSSGVLTASLGLAIYSGDVDYGEELINKADEALYKVKLSHKNGIRLYSSMFRDLKKEFEDSEPVLINTLQTLLTVINARDRYTYGHSERVVEYAMAIGKELNLPKEKLRLLRYAAFLHDIGKIEIGRSVLNKKGRLDSKEWDLIRKHTIFGVNIVEPMQDLEEIIPAVMYHHERYDGEGYPQGLSGEEIPLLARILAVADSFDAMTTNRPYRGAMTQEEAIEELKREKGTQFDPKIVDTFIEVVDEVYEDINLRVS